MNNLKVHNILKQTILEYWVNSEHMVQLVFFMKNISESIDRV